MEALKKMHENDADSELIPLIVQGETDLYEILIRRYNSFLYRIGRTYNYNHQDTEDLMQETYISAFSNLGGFKNLSSFRTWITRIMLNQCYHKKQKFSFKNETAVSELQIEKTTPMFQHQPNNEKILLNKELGNVLENALQRLPEDYKVVFTLRELNGLSVSEAAQAIDISVSNVKVRLNRAKGMLREEIKKMYSPQDIFEFNLIYCDKIVENVMGRIHEMVKNSKLV